MGQLRLPSVLDGGGLVVNLDLDYRTCMCGRYRIKDTDALTEELQLKDGRIASKDLRALGILRAKDMPEIECIFIEENEPAGPYGAKGVGEIGLVPTAPAVAGALYKFDGIRRTKLPMKDSPAARAILGKK